MRSIIQETDNMKIKNLSEIILGIIIVGYVIFFSYLSIHRMYALNSHYYDLGIMNQVVYNTSRGHFLEITSQEFRQNISRLTIHFDPILAVFAPLYWLYSGPEILLIVQTLVLASGALAIFLISKKILKNRWMGLVFATSYLMFFAVERANLFDFHAVTLTTGFLLWMIYFSLQKKWIPTFIFIFLALLTKEHVGLIIFLFGGYLFFIRRDKKIGLITGVLGLVSFVLTTFVIIPYFRGQEHFALKYYSNLTNISFLETKDYLIRLLLPHLPYMVFSPLEFFISLPEVMINTLSSNDNMRGYYFHYSSLIVPFIFFSAICGAAKIQKIKFRYIILFIFIILSLNSIYNYNPLPLKFFKEPYYYLKLNDDKINIIKEWQKVFFDDEIKIAATPKLAPFFSSRHYYYNFLFDPSYENVKVSKEELLSRISKYDQADYVIINREEIGDLNKPNLQVTFYKHLVLNKQFKKIFSDNKLGIEVYKKI